MIIKGGQHKLVGFADLGKYHDVMARLTGIEIL